MLTFQQDYDPKYTGKAKTKNTWPRQSPLFKLIEYLRQAFDVQDPHEQN